MEEIGGLLSYAIFGLLIPLVFTLSFIVFVWGALQYFIAGGHDEEAREKGKSLMFYGFLVLAVMAAVGAILRYIANALT